MTKHTPAPWKIRAWGKTISIDAEKETGIAFLGDLENSNSGIPDQQDMANARLIKESPILLQALKDLLAAIKQARTVKAPAGHYDEDVYYNGIDFYAQMDVAEEIIARAEGPKAPEKNEQPERPEFPIYYDNQGREHAEF